MQNNLNKGNITTRSETEDKLEFSLNRPNFTPNDTINLNLPDKPITSTNSIELVSTTETKQEEPTIHNKKQREISDQSK